VAQFPYGRAMDVEPVHDHDQWLTQLAMQPAQIGDHARRADVFIVNLEGRADTSSLRGQAQAADDAQAIMPLRDVLHGTQLDSRTGRPAAFADE
jgi:hypothetical protein